MTPAATLLLAALKVEEARQRLQAEKARTSWEESAERRLTRQFQQILGKTSKKVVEEFVNRGRLPDPTRIKGLVMKEVEAVMAEMASTMTEGVEDAMTHGRNRTISDLQKAGTSIGFSEFSGDVSRMISEHVFEASQSTIERITGEVTDNLTQSYEEGLGVREAGVRLDDVFEGLERHEAERIARTEIQSFQNRGAYMTERELGLEFHKWVAAEDDRTREDHLYMHGEITRVGDPFSNGLEFPGDRAHGEVRDWVNCRCRIVPFLMPEGFKAPDQDRFREYELEPVGRDRDPVEPTDDVARDFVRQALQEGRSVEQIASQSGIGGEHVKQMMAAAMSGLPVPKLPLGAVGSAARKLREAARRKYRGKAGQGAKIDTPQDARRLERKIKTQEWYNDLPEDDKEALREHLANPRKSNKQIAEAAGAPLTGGAAKVQAALLGRSLPEPVRVYRVVPRDKLPMGIIEPGATLQYKGFSQATMREDVLREYAKTVADAVVVDITVLEGSQAELVDVVGRSFGNPRENSTMLMAAGTRYRVTRVRRNAAGLVTRIFLEAGSGV